MDEGRTKWISVKDRLPPLLDDSKDYSCYVWVTCGEIIEIGNYIYRPRSYGCAVSDDYQEAACGADPHWHLERDIPSFVNGDMCFGRIEISEIKHWMPLPEPPSDIA